MPDRQEPPDRLEREINEILSNIERFPSADQRKQRARKRAFSEAADAIAARQRALARALARLSASQLMLLSFVMILGSFFFRQIVPIAWPWMMYGGVVLFMASFALMVFGGGRHTASSGPPQYWRGRPVSYRPPTFALRLRRWWNRRQH